MSNKELSKKLNKEMTEELNVKKPLMITKKEDQPEMKIDKPSQISLESLTLT